MHHLLACTLPAAVSGRLTFAVCESLPADSPSPPPRCPAAGAGLGPDAVVVLRVPPSSTFPAGAMLCDVMSASDDSLTCTTRGHLAANASAQDPLAATLQPQPTAPG